MAMSDTLFDAAEQIRDYRRNGPWDHQYDREVDLLLMAMDVLRVKLDTPPLTPAQEAAAQELVDMAQELGFGY